MSDISIPGVDSKYNTDKLIKETMKLERKPLERMEETKKEYQEQKKAWSTANQRLSNLVDTAKQLYGFENPFQNYIAESSNSSVLTATADRTASESLEKVKVLQTAGRDVFHSRSLPEGYEVPKGEYGFALGGKETSFSYEGGSLQDFAETVSKKGKGLVNARTVRDTTDTRVIVFEGGKTGKHNTLNFLKDAQSFGLDSGLLEKIVSNERNITPSKENVATWNGSEANSFTVAGGAVTVNPQGAASLSVSPSLRLEDSLQLKIDVQIENIPKEEQKKQTPPPGPSIPSQGGVELDGVQVQNESSKADLPEWQPPEPPKTVDSLDVLSINGKQKLPALKDTESTQTIRVDASQFDGSISSIVVDNVNTHRKISLKNVEVVDPNARGEFSPAHAASRASNARLEVNGVEIERPTNTIDDVVPGVTLNPQASSPQSVELNVNPDKEAIKESILNFIGNYNRTLTEINILTSNDEAVIDEISYLEEGEKEDARKRLGLFQGDSTFTQLKNRLQRIVSAPYDTDDGRRMSMLSQMGISTNATGFGGGVTRSKLRGYLELDESKFDKAIDEHLPSIKQLFGRDTDGDKVIDSGLAYRINDYVKTYTQTGGIIANRKSTIDTRISGKEEDISDLKDRLDRKEQDLKRKYGQMESTIGQMEKDREAIQNLNSQGGQ